MVAALVLAGALGCDAKKEPLASLNMPLDEHGPLPARLSQTGAFKDLKTLTPADGLVPYDVNVHFWSDGAAKSRWMALPRGGQIGFSATGEWSFPAGTVFVKHFDMVVDERQPAQPRRLETRFLVLDTAGGVYGVSYKWRSDGSDADLLTGSVTEPITIQTAAGPRQQDWYYPAPADCRTCHTGLAGKVLAVNTRQINRDFPNPATGAIENQLRAWNCAGRFKSAIREEDIPKLARLAPAGDRSRSIEDRARSWLDANCSNCHRPGGAAGLFDARYDTPPDRQNLVNGPVLIDLGIRGARVIAPHDPARSIILARVNTLKRKKMPPLARETIDSEGVGLLRDWIRSLPNPPASDPPTTTPSGGEDQP